MKKITLFLAVGLALTGIANAQRVTVTVAGSGYAGYTGDGGSSKLAQVSGPKDVCMDAAENIYFVDKANGRIRKVSAQKGVITTVAGGGSSIVDGVPAITAAIVPNYICVGTTGNLYFTTGNQIKKVDAASGLIYTIAGSLTSGYTGDGSFAMGAMLNNPQGIAIDAANDIYVVDRGNHAIRKINGTTGIITTIAGNGTPGFSGDGGPATASLLRGPVCVCVSSTGDVYFSDQNPTYPSYDNSIIRKISATTGNVTHICGVTSGGVSIYDVPAISAILGTITGICMNENEDGFYCNEMSCSCREMLFSTDTLYEIAGDFSIQSYSDDITSPLANMNIPYGLCADHRGNIYVADSNNQRVRKILRLQHTPRFAFGHGQYIDPVIGVAYSLDSLCWVTDLDLGQTESWSIVTPPAHGTLAGFPATASSNGDHSTTKPVGLSYTANSTYAGGDFFRVQVTDDGTYDTVNVYVGALGSIGTLSTGNTKNVTTAISIFPNPASSVLNVEWSNMQSKNAKIVITDIADRVYNSATLANNNGSGSAQIDISSLPSGAYFVRVDGTEARKFVKE